MNLSITDFYKESFVKAVIEANKELYNYIHTKLSSDDLNYSLTIGYGGDKTLNIDLIAENIFIKYLKEFGNIYSEECGYKNFNKEFDIIVDPLDGSDNFACNLEYYGTSIALKKNNETLAGFVCNLATSSLIYKAFDKGVFEILIDENKMITNTNIQSKFAIFERAYKYPKLCQKLHEKSIKFRSLGAAALSLANAKNYNFVLFIGEIREFDIAAAMYICSELFIYKTDNFLLISKNKCKFELIKDIIKEE